MVAILKVDKNKKKSDDRDSRSCLKGRASRRWCKTGASRIWWKITLKLQTENDSQ